MKVTLINYTPEARELLLFTKQTRLSMDAGLMEEIRSWPEEKKEQELRYMLGTIQSSWEFVNYVFSIEGVSRAFTHQFVRTRDAEIPGEDYCGPRHKKMLSVAQQSQRTVNMGEFGYVHTEKTDFGKDRVSFILHEIKSAYNAMVEQGEHPQDARGILPTNIETNLIAGFNLRTLSEMAKLRLCSRTQGEYQNIFRLMRLAILNVHPWAEPFLRVYCAATGVCQFPNYNECPIKGGIYNPETGQRHDNKMLYLPWTKEEIQQQWKWMKFEAVPKEMKK